MPAWDVIVVGLGAMGSAAAEHLSRRGARVLGVERFGIAHDKGSSHGRSRVIRLAYWEDPCFVPLLLRAYENWRELERRSGESILTVTGTLELGASDSPIVAGSLASCLQYGLMHRMLGHGEIRERFPMFELDPGTTALWQPDGGFLRPEVAIRTNLALAANQGASLRFGERVREIRPRAGSVEVVTNAGVHEAGCVIVSAGAWVGSLVPELAAIARPTRQVLGWFWPRQMEGFGLGSLPVFLSDEGDAGDFYGFPAFEDSAVKIARHGHLDESLVPDEGRAPVNDRDIEVLRGFLKRRMPLLDGAPVKTATCTYTNLPDGFFLIDRSPQDKRIVVASPCSGHGFKFSSVVGEILADLATEGASRLPIAPFSFAALQERLERTARAGRRADTG